MSAIRFRSSNLIFAGIVIIALLFSMALTPSVHGNNDTDSPDGLATLMAGNKRFIAGQLKAKDYLAERLQLAQEQHPYAIILTCADSRLSPEILFDESVGRLFVIRTAGHVVDPVALGSIEYAVEHLHVPLLFVLGHDSCGAVKAAIAGGDTTPNIQALITRIKPAVDKVLSRGLTGDELLKASVAENVRYQMQRSVYESDLINSYVFQHKLTIAGGVYHLPDGSVELVSTDLAVVRTGELLKAATADTPTPAKADAGKATLVIKNEKPKEKDAQPAVNSTFAESIRTAYVSKRKLILKKTMLMRDEQDRCATDGCRSIPAGDLVSLESPLILNVMGQKELKVMYKGRPYYILADSDAMVIASK